MKKSRAATSVLIATTDGLTLATTSAMLGRAGDWVKAKGIVDCEVVVPPFAAGVAGVVVPAGGAFEAAGGLGGADVLVVDRMPQPALRSRDKITKGKTNSSLISVFFIINSLFRFNIY